MLDPHLMLATLQHEERLAESAHHRAARAVAGRRRAVRRAARLVAGADRLGAAAERLRRRAAVLDAAPSRTVAETA